MLGESGRRDGASGVRILLKPVDPVQTNRATSDGLLQAGGKFLGPGYKEIGKQGSGVFRSADGTRQFRIDGNSLAGSHAPDVPHGHLETFAPGAAKPSANNHISFVY